MSSTAEIEPNYPLKSLLELRARELDDARLSLGAVQRGLDEARGEVEASREAARRAEEALEGWRREIDARRASGFSVAEACAQAIDEQALRDRVSDARAALEAARLLERAAEVEVERARGVVEEAQRQHEVTSRHHERWRQQAQVAALAREEAELEELFAHKAARRLLEDEP